MAPQSVFCTVIASLPCRVLWFQLWTWLWVQSCSGSIEILQQWCDTSLRGFFVCVSFTFTLVWFTVSDGELSAQRLARRSASCLWGHSCGCFYCLRKWRLVPSSRLSDSRHNAWWPGTDGERHEIHLSLQFTCGFNCLVFVFFQGVCVSVCMCV